MHRSASADACEACSLRIARILAFNSVGIATRWFCEDEGERDVGRVGCKATRRYFEVQCHQTA